MAARGPGRPPGRQGADLLAVAREAFLQRGFDATTMQEVASRAGVSKASLYREHPSKDALFVAVVADWTERGRGAMAPHLDALLASDPAADGLRDFAEILLDAVLSAPVARMRRLVAAEGERFPTVAAAYVRASWDANIEALAAALATLGRRGALSVDEPVVAAQQLVWLAVGGPLNRQTLTGGAAPGPAARRAQAAAAVDTFLARYGPRPAAGGRP